MTRCAICSVYFPISLFIWRDKEKNKYYNLRDSVFNKEMVCDKCAKFNMFERVDEMICDGCRNSFVLKVGHLFIDNYTAACWICMSKFRAWQSSKVLNQNEKGNY